MTRLQTAGLVVGAITPHSGLSGKALPKVLVLKANRMARGMVLPVRIELATSPFVRSLA
jgi:hypothetical protein